MPGTGIYPDFYNNLPGSVMELRDGIKNMQNNSLSGKNVYLIGTAIDGPVLEPISPESFNDGEKTFGRYYDKATKTYNGASLMKGYERALRAGATNVTLLRVSGSHASASIKMNEELKTKTYQAREYAGKYAGNVEQTFDLELVVKEGFDDVYANDVSVYADGAMLNSYKYTVNSNAGTVTLHEDATNSGAVIDIYYKEVDVNIYNVTAATPEDMTGEGVQFKLDNENLIEGSDILTWSDTGVLEEPAYSIDYQAGIVTFERAIEETETIEFEYDWKDLTEEEAQASFDAEGSDFFVDLEHTADASKAMVVTVGGIEVDPVHYNVNYTSYDTSRVFIDAGVGELNEDVYVKYYYSKEELIQPEIEAESVYGGNLYNKVKFEMQDVLYEDELGNKTESVEAGEELNVISSTKARLNNEYIVPNDAFGITITRTDASESTLTVANGDISVNWANGIITILDNALAFRPDDISATADAYEYYNVSSKVLKLYKPEEKRIETEDLVIEFPVGDVINTLGELVAAVNAHPSNNVVRLSIPEEYVAISAMNLKTPDVKINAEGNTARTATYLSKGKDGINITKEEIYELLGGSEERPGAYDILLEDEEADIVVPLGVYADDMLASEFKKFDQQLANFCAKAFFRNNEIRGIIGTKPLSKPSRINVINRVKELQLLDTNYFLTDDNGNEIRDREGNKVDVGKFISVVAHDFLVADRNLAVASPENGAALYAGLASQLAETNSPTNEKVPGARSAYKLSNTQANLLAGNKLVVFMVKGGIPKVASALTCAQPNSGWTRYLTVDIVFNAINLLRDIYDPYIGQGNTIEKRNSLDSDIYNALKKKNTIADFDYTLIQSPSDKVMGRMVVELDIVPIGELQKIHTVVSINAQLD